MSCNILLYGATGYSGGLIISEMKLRHDNGSVGIRMILGGRDAARLASVAAEHDMEYRVFGLDDRRDVRRGLQGIDVLVNAAGPFAWTAERLAKVALEVGCHYVDINGEADVYTRLDDLNLPAKQRGLAMVSGAGFWSAASDLLLDAALEKLRPQVAPQDPVEELGAIRIAMSRIKTFSRGSAATVWRSLREQVTVVRAGSGDANARMVLWHEPVGKLERTFDFSDSRQADLRITSAASLVDTLTARLTAARRRFVVRTIESYVETGLAGRIGYQIGSLFAPVAAIPVVRALVQQPLGLLEEGPTKNERDDEKHVILLDIEDRFRARIIDWRWETPNVYQFTAQLVVEVATRIAASELVGWVTPAQVIGPKNPEDLTVLGESDPLRGCHLNVRTA